MNPIDKSEVANLNSLQKIKEKWLWFSGIFASVAAKFGIDVLDHLTEWNTEPRFFFWVGTVIAFGSIASYFHKKHDVAKEAFEEAQLVERLRKLNLLSLPQAEDNAK